MTRMFETGEITKLLDVLIGKTEAVGETNEDERRLDNLKTLIDVTNWYLDGLQFAMASGYGRAEYSMAEISYMAQCALDNYRGWIADVLDEQIADHKTELKTEVKGSKRLLKGSDEPQIGCRTCIHNESGWYEKGSLSCGRCCSDNFEFYEPKTEPQTDCQWK